MMNHREKIFVPHANNPEGPVLLKSGGWAFTQMNNREGKLCKQRWAKPSNDCKSGSAQRAGPGWR